MSDVYEFFKSISLGNQKPKQIEREKHRQSTWHIQWLLNKSCPLVVLGCILSLVGYGRAEGGGPCSHVRNDFLIREDGLVEACIC